MRACICIPLRVNQTTHPQQAITSSKSRIYCKAAFRIASKTDTIAIAIEAFLRKSPNSRVAIVSQANVAVDEALHKLKSRYPGCDIVRHVSAHALDSLAESSKDITQHKLREEFIFSLCQQTTLSQEAAELRERFRFECQDEAFVAHRILRALTESASVYGCTLSMLGRLSLGSALFDLVVVDEAAKASLPECMIAAIAAKRLVLVGDHHQLQGDCAILGNLRESGNGASGWMMTW